MSDRHHQQPQHRAQVSYGSTSVVEPAVYSSSAEAPSSATPGSTNVDFSSASPARMLAQSTAFVTSAAGRVTRFVLRRKNVRRQSFGDVIHSMRRPAHDGGADDHYSLGAQDDPNVPPSFYGHSAGTPPGSDFVGLESLRPARPPTLHPEPKLGTTALLSAVVSIVLCSRFGVEATVSAAGPLYSLVGLACIPWVWYLPTGLVVAELATAVPSNAGVLMWTNVAFSPRISFFCLFVTLLLAIAGLAVASALTTAYIGRALNMPDAVLLLLRAVCIGLSAGVNAWTVDGLGVALKVITVLTVLPFLILTAIQVFGHGLDGRAMGATADSIDFRIFLPYLAFTHSGVENLGSLVEDTKAPEKTLFRAIAPAMIASFFIYLFPVAAAVSALHEYHDFSAWQPGYWGHVGTVIGGEWLGYYMEWGGVVARFGTVLGTLATSARLIAGMGSMNAFPTVMSNFLAMYHDKRFTPVNAIITVSAAALPFAVALSMDTLVAIFQVLTCTRLLIAVYAAFFVLRVKHPELPRPYRVPVGTKLAAVLLAPGIVFTIGVLVCAVILNVASMIISGCALLIAAGAAVACVKFLRPEGLAGRIEEFEINEVPPSSFIEEE